LNAKHTGRFSKMDKHEIIDGFYFVERGWLNGNHFVFKGNETVLIDTGYRGHLRETLRILSDLGVDAGKVDRIITTHIHCDHIGAHAHIQRTSGCKILLSRIDKYFIDSRNDWFTWWRYYDQEAEFFNCGGVLEEGDAVTLGGARFEVFHTPGHASGGLIFFERDRSLLISSDALWSNDIGALTPRIEGNMCTFLALDSLDKIERLGARTAYPGHGPVIHDVPAAVERCRSRLAYYLENPRAQGMDQIKKIMVYVLLMKNGFAEEKFYPYLKSTHWFPETVDLFLGGRYEAVYREAVEQLMERGAVYSEDGVLKAGVKP
jgi:hydroxyacylglutathione hydrolase